MANNEVSEIKENPSGDSIIIPSAIDIRSTLQCLSPDEAGTASKGGLEETTISARKESCESMLIDNFNDMMTNRRSIQRRDYVKWWR